MQTPRPCRPTLRFIGLLRRNFAVFSTALDALVGVPVEGGEVFEETEFFRGDVVCGADIGEASGEVADSGGVELVLMGLRRVSKLK